MALFRAIENARPARNRLFADPYAILFLDDGLKRAVKISRLPLMGRVICKIIHRKGPGALSSGIARTKYIDDLLQKTVGNGVKQIIILGAGFDTRALRLDFVNAIPIFEIDHPDTAKWKIAKLQETIGQLPQNVSYLQIDFNKESLGDLARKYNLDSNMATTFIWEGVTNYLSPEAIHNTFEFIEKFTSPSYIIFTYIDRLVLDNPKAFIGTDKLFKNLSRNEERWTFGWRPAELSGYLAKFHLTLLEDLGADEYRSRYMADRKALSRGYEFYRVAYAMRG